MPDPSEQINLPPLPDCLASFTPSEADHARLKAMVRAYAHEAIMAYRAARAAPGVPAGASMPAEQWLHEIHKAAMYSGYARIGIWDETLANMIATAASQFAIPASPPAPSQQAEPPPGWKLLKDTTHEERSYPDDAKHENGAYFNNCVTCLRQFVGHKRRGVCRACRSAQQAEPIPDCRS